MLETCCDFEQTESFVVLVKRTHSLGFWSVGSQTFDPDIEAVGTPGRDLIKSEGFAYDTMYVPARGIYSLKLAFVSGKQKTSLNQFEPI